MLQIDSTIMVTVLLLLMLMSRHIVRFSYYDDVAVMLYLQLVHMCCGEVIQCDICFVPNKTVNMHSFFCFPLQECIEPVSGIAHDVIINFKVYLIRKLLVYYNTMV